MLPTMTEQAVQMIGPECFTRETVAHASDCIKLITQTWYILLFLVFEYLLINMYDMTRSGGLGMYLSLFKI